MPWDTIVAMSGALVAEGSLLAVLSAPAFAGAFDAYLQGLEPLTFDSPS